MADAVDVVDRGRGTGGGDAGHLARARRAARRRLRGPAFPREKPCGEGMMPAAWRCSGASGCATPSVGARSRASATTASASPPRARFASPGRAGDDRAGAATPPPRRRAARPRPARRPASRLYEDAAVEGAEIESGRAVGLRVGRRAPARRAGGRRRRARVSGAALAGARVAARARGRVRRANALSPGARAHARRQPGDLRRPRPRALRRARCPTASCLLAGLGERGSARRQRARRARALDRRRAVPARRSRRRHAPHGAGRARARGPPRARRVRARAPCCSATPPAPATR